MRWPVLHSHSITRRLHPVWRQELSQVNAPVVGAFFRANLLGVVLRPPRYGPAIRFLKHVGEELEMNCGPLNQRFGRRHGVVVG